MNFIKLKSIQSKFYFLMTLYFCFTGYFFQLHAEAENKKIALLFLTREGVNHPDFWISALSKNLDKFNVYLYSDHPVKTPFFKQFGMKETIPTSWERHIKTWQLLLREAYQNTDNYKFVYLSESCLPIIPLEEIYQFLIKDSQSYMCYAGTWWSRDSSREVTGLPIEHRWGNHEWVILNRKHAEMIVNDTEVIDIVSNSYIDSESYPSTLFSVCNCLNEFISRTTTFVNWNLPEGGGAHPYQFREDNDFNFSMLMDAKRKGNLFARKFAPSFPVKAIHRVINTQP